MATRSWRGDGYCSRCWQAQFVAEFWVCFPGRSHADPGKHSPRLGIPGLYYSALSGLVWLGEEWWKRKGFQQESVEFQGHGLTTTCTN